MRSFKIEIEWRIADDEQGLSGPEIPTFADLEIWIDDVCVTSCRTNPRQTEQRKYVIGPLSGLADWLVDHWMEIFWQTHTPFPKVKPGEERVPDYDDVLRSEYQQIDIAAYGQWYACHCLGHSGSDLALPTILFIPEDTQVGLALGPAPSLLGSSCTFVLEQDRGVAWISKDDLGAELERFVSSIIEKASQDSPTAAWAAWLNKRFVGVLGKARDLTERRRLMFGDIVADHWECIEGELGGNAKILDGILIDSDPIQSTDDLSPLVSHVKRLASERVANPFWTSIQASPGEQMLPDFVRGYRRAERVRRALNLGDDPIDFREVLDALQIGLQKIPGPAIARSAFMVAESGAAEVSLFTSHPMSKGLGPRRFSLATALGGLFASRSQTMPYGGANSDQARWARSREAKAFAAMFLLPASPVEANQSLEQLVDNYGISHTAASWHIENIRQRQRLGSAGMP
jgi:hypothetical protein